MSVDIIVGDCLASLKAMPSCSVHCIVTSPPYFGLRDYGHDGQIGMEATPEAFVQKLVDVFREARRVLRDDGTLWLNLGDSYVANAGGGPGDTIGSDGYARSNRRERGRARKIPGGLKSKDLIGIPWRVAFALQADGWYLRQDIIWHKPNPMPESVRDRCTKAHEYIFMMSKAPRYYFDAEAMKEPAIWAGRRPSAKKGSFVAKGEPQPGVLPFGAITETRNRRSVWTVTTKPFKGAHFATFPPDLIEPCVLAGCPPGGAVLDPFFGAGTTGLVTERSGRNCIGIEINAVYADLARARLGLPSLSEISDEFPE